MAERLENPHVSGSTLSGAVNIHKIKLRQAGYRLVYSVEDNAVIVTVIAVGKCDRNEICEIALPRLQQ
jgi:mRNA interferase RelE/StbE